MEPLGCGLGWQREVTRVGLWRLKPDLPGPTIFGFLVCHCENSNHLTSGYHGWSCSTVPFLPGCTERHTKPQAKLNHSPLKFCQVFGQSDAKVTNMISVPKHCFVGESASSKVATVLSEHLWTTCLWPQLMGQEVMWTPKGGRPPISQTTTSVLDVWVW